MIIIRILDTHARIEAKSGILFKDFFLKVREGPLPFEEHRGQLKCVGK